MSLAAADATSFSRLSRFAAAHPVLVLLLACVPLTLVWGLPLLISPLSTDEAYYALGGRTVVEGGTLYLDIWDIKPPAIYLTYAFGFVLGGEHSEALRVLELAMAVLTTASVGLLTRRFFNLRAALFAAALYAYTYFYLARVDALGEAESFMAAPMLLAFWLYQPRDGDRNALLAAFAAGLLLGVAVAFKFSAVFLVVGLPAAELILRQRGSWSLRGAVVRLTIAAVAFLAVQGVWVTYLLAIDAWSAFVDIQVNYSLPYNDFRWSPPGIWYPRHGISSTAYWLTNNAVLSIPAWGALFLCLIKRPPAGLYLLAGLCALCAGSVWWQGKFFEYHWLVLPPFLAPLAGYGVDEFLELTRTLTVRSRRIVAGLLVLGFVVITFSALARTYDIYSFFVERVAGTMTQVEVDDEYYPEMGMNHQLVDYIRAHGAPDDTFYIWGFWTIPHFWEPRDFPSRFVANHPLRALWAPTEWRLELMGELEGSRPRFIAVAAGDRQPWLTGTYAASDEDFCNFAELRRFVDSRYKAVLNNGLFVLYDREAPVHTALPRCVP